MSNKVIAVGSLIFEEYPDVIAHILRDDQSNPNTYLINVLMHNEQQTFPLTGQVCDITKINPKQKLRLPGSPGSVEVSQEGLLILRNCVPINGETLLGIIKTRIAYILHYEIMAQEEEARNPGLYSKNFDERMQALARDEMSNIRKWHSEAKGKGLVWYPDIVEYAKEYCPKEYAFIEQYAPELFEENLPTQLPTM